MFETLKNLTASPLFCKLCNCDVRLLVSEHMQIARDLMGIWRALNLARAAVYVMFDMPLSEFRNFSATHFTSQDKSNDLFKVKKVFAFGETTPDIGEAIRKVWETSSKHGPENNFPIRAEEIGRQFSRAKTIGLISSADAANLAHIMLRILRRWDQWCTVSKQQATNTMLTKLGKRHRLSLI